MESIAASSGTSALVRPVIALQGDLSAVLREGRVLSGEVMQSLDGGSILIGIGEHRVPVQSQVRLPLGQRLLFVVERRGGELVLRLLSGEPGELDPLVRAIRGLLGSEVSAGRLLGQLRRLLQATPDGGSPSDRGSPDARSELLVVQMFAALTGSAESLPEVPRALLEARLRQAAAILRESLAPGTGARPSASMLSARLNDALAATLPELAAAQRARVVAELASSELAGGPTGPPGDLSAGSGRAVDPAVFAKLAEQLEELAFRPGADGATLRDAIGRSGETFRLATLAALSALFDAGGGGEPRGAVEELARALGGVLARQVAVADDGGILAALRTLVEPALRALLRQPGLARLVEDGGFEALVRGFASELVRAARSQRGATGERLASALAGLDPAALLRGKRPALLAALLAVGLGGGGGTDRLVQAVLAGLAGPAHDLSGSLLAGLLELPQGSVREAALRSLAGIELENLLNLARREFGESWHWSFPLPDGGGWTTAHLFARVGDEGTPGAASEEEAFRLTLGVELTHLGPVRGDLVFRGSRISLRLRVARAEVAERLRSDLADLQQELAMGGSEVLLSVSLAPPDEAAVDELLRDIRFLREHHVMDMQG